MLLFHIVWMENRNPFIPAVLTVLSRRAACITSFTTCGRFPICITFCSGNVNKRFRKIPAGIINTFVEQATNRAAPTKKIWFYSSPIFNTARRGNKKRQRSHFISLHLGFTSGKYSTMRNKRKCSGPHRIWLSINSWRHTHFFSLISSSWCFHSFQVRTTSSALSLQEKTVKPRQEVCDLPRPHSTAQSTVCRPSADQDTLPITPIFSTCCIKTGLLARGFTDGIHLKMHRIILYAKYNCTACIWLTQLSSGIN